MITIKLINFTKTPGARYTTEGKHSGEQWRDEYLFPQLLNAMELDDLLFVDLDNTAGIGTGFLEEVFGGLIRIKNIDGNDLLKRLIIKSDDEPEYIDEVCDYIKDAIRNKNHKHI